MAQLCLYLTPFAADYSGVASALFDLGGLIAINDASCCTAHYVYCDEPRWNTRQQPVLCTTLRNIDAILGNDSKVVREVCEAASKLASPLVAVVGTPVPAITGMDTVGIAHEIEAATGIPSLGFDTTGFNWYDHGIVMAGRALIERFAADGLEREPGLVNILGMTPLDYGDKGNDADLVALLEDAGLHVGCRLFMGLEMESIRRIGAASLNLAVSASGLRLAKSLKRRFGTPYVVGFPMGAAHAERWLEQRSVPASREQGGPSTLIVGDQVLANSLRDALQMAGLKGRVDVASFFGWDATIAREGDKRLKDEASYLRLLRDGAYDRLIADPTLCAVPQAAGLRRVEFVHSAVSGKLRWDEARNLVHLDVEVLIREMDA
ncbi:MAG: hypothetical protein IJH83_07650 [Coriobacteriales bacterium]|nr:hypothetical protein [Coriobacteriales bacterium]